MNATKYLGSQKGRVVEKMKVAYLSGKHIMVVEKLDETLLYEIINDSSIIPLLKLKKEGGLGKVFEPTIQYVVDQNKLFIVSELSDVCSLPTIYVYMCKETSMESSPQTSKLPDSLEQSLDNFVFHLSGLNKLRLSPEADFPKNRNALQNSIILLVTDTHISIPAKYAPYTEYIRVPFVEKDEFNEVASVIIAELDTIGLVKNSLGYSVIDKPDADSFLRKLRDNMKGLYCPLIKAILRKTKIEMGCIYSDDKKFTGKVMAFVRAEANTIISLSNSLSIVDSSEAAEPAALEGMSKWIKQNKDIIIGNTQYEYLEIKSPKGILVSGVPGTGKSMMAKYIARLLELPLIKFDLGDLLGGYVGDSEKNMRESLNTIDALAPCVVWVDEMEKAFSNSNTAHEVTKRLIGKFLTWMQEKKSSSFVFATANDISCMPPEMFRSGRFDEKFYTFLPTAKDCAKIFEMTINHQNKLHKRRTSNNLEAKPLFASDVNSEMFLRLLNTPGLCIKEPQNDTDRSISRKNKFYIGSDIAKLIENAKMLFVKKEGFQPSFASGKFEECLIEAINEFKPYGETNLDDVAKCYSQLAHINFSSACDKNSVILPFEGYDELRCSSTDNGDLYDYTSDINPSQIYDYQMFISVRNALNTLGKSKFKTRHLC